MSTNKSKKELCESFDGFGGLDISSPIGSGRMSTFKNFKLLPDGSAIKRSGFRHVASLDGESRGEIPFTDGEEEIILAAVGKSLVRVSVLDGSVESAEIFDSAEGCIKFFDFLGNLYIMEGHKLFRYVGGCEVEECIPYIPLYGKGWDPRANPGTVNQPMNLLTPKIRISYTCNNVTVYDMQVGLPIKSIDGVFRGTSEFPSQYYSISSSGTAISFGGYSFNGEVTVYLTIDVDSFPSADFESCDRVDVFDLFDASRIFVYGGADEGRTYVSQPISEDMELIDKSVYANVAPVYFPNISPVRFSGIDHITTMARFFDRMLIFSEHRSFVTDSLRSDEGKARMGLLINTASSTTGCASDKGNCFLGIGIPVTVSHGGIYKWEIDSEFEEKITLTNIAPKVSAAFDRDFLTNALVCYNRGENEIWFGNKRSENGDVLVYNCASGNWYMYDGISADRFFEIGEKLAFKKGNGFYVFDGEEGYDCFEWSERDIEAVIESAEFDFGDPSPLKHVDRVNLTCGLDGGSILLELTDGKPLLSLELDESRSSNAALDTDFFDLRVRTPRTQRAKFKLVAAGRNRQRIYGIIFFAD